MYNIIALIGEAGSGKDYTLQAALAANPQLHEIINCTTRPKREGESNGVNYYYYTHEHFNSKILNGEMLECTIFNDNWLYGTSYESVRGDNVLNIGVFSPTAIKQLLDNPSCNVLVFKIQTNDKIRLLRQLNRENSPNVREIVRRFQADYNDFNNIDFDYILLNNDDESDIETNILTIFSQSDRYFEKGQG